MYLCAASRENASDPAVPFPVYGAPIENRHGNIPLEGARLVEDLDAIAVAVAHVQQAVTSQHDAMHDVDERAAHARRRPRRSCPGAPTAAGTSRSCRRPRRACCRSRPATNTSPFAGIHRDHGSGNRTRPGSAFRKRGFQRAVLGVDLALHADLQQQLAGTREYFWMKPSPLPAIQMLPCGIEGASVQRLRHHLDDRPTSSRRCRPGRIP